jgi:hypothetical protein
VKITQKEEHLEIHYPRNIQNSCGMLMYESGKRKTMRINTCNVSKIKGLVYCIH